MPAFVNNILLFIFLISQFALSVHAYEHDMQHGESTECELSILHQPGTLGLATFTDLKVVSPATDEDILVTEITDQSSSFSGPGNKSPPYIL